VSAHLVVGQAVEIALEGAEDEPVKGVVFGLPPREMLFTFPDLRSPTAELTVGRLALVRFWSGVGAHVAQTTVLRVAGGPPVTAAFERPLRVETVQRRRFFRVNAALPARLTVERSSVEGGTGALDEKAIVRDLSAGGLRLETAVLLTIDDRVRIGVTTPRVARPALPDTLEADARVVRVAEGPTRGERLYTLGLELLFGAETERDRWVQLSFELQRGLKP
jgi:hypothetical protein